MHSHITQKWITDNIAQAVFLNDQSSLPTIPPYRDVPRLMTPQVLPTATRLTPKRTNRPVEMDILDFMLSKSIRRGAKSLILPHTDTLLERIRTLVKNNRPITLVLPSLPFKDVSPFGTGTAIDHTDLGEYAFFAQMKRILDGISHLYPPGAHMTVLCDGYIYADIFTDGDTDGAGRYKAACDVIKNKYDLYNTVTLFDMREVFFDIPEWKHIQSEIEAGVRIAIAEHADSRDRIDHLMRRFKYYVALRGETYESARLLYKDELSGPVLEKLKNAAIQYVTVHLTMRITNVVQRAFPSAIRCTVHPKDAAQFPLHVTNQYNQLLPYNGVAVVSKETLLRTGSLFQSVRVKRLCDVLAIDGATALYVPNGTYPHYYEIP
jgi:pyoverdine/dityrosine biosynthesis protein Dit1